MFGFSRKLMTHVSFEKTVPSPTTVAPDRAFLDPFEVSQRIEYLAQEVEKIESITGPSMRTRRFRNEIAALKQYSSRC